MEKDDSEFPGLEIEKLLGEDPSKAFAIMQEYMEKAGMSFGDVSEPEPNALIDALASPETSPAEIEVMLRGGADPNKTRLGYHKSIEHPLAIAVRTGNPDIVRLLLDAGADVHFLGDHNYSIMLNACHGHDIQRGDRQIELLTLLLDRGANPNLESSFGESALRSLAFAARYDAVRLLLVRGADSETLCWTPLHRAIAIGSVEDVQQELQNDPDLEAMGCNEFTPILIALQIGDLAKVQLLQAAGANLTPKTKWIGAYSCAFQSRNLEVLKYLLDQKIPFVTNPNYDVGPISEVIQNGTPDMVTLVLDFFANNPHFQEYLDKALSDDEEGRYARLLIERGANSTELKSSAKRRVLGHECVKGEALEAVTPEQYAAARNPRFGKTNPEEVRDLYWDAMIRLRCSGYDARKHFGDEPIFGCNVKPDPVWCADRFGQSMTFLPDGRIIEIAGEHEDSYDPDFCIYNDVFEHSQDGSIRVFCYPREIFPPTDFHTATLVGNWIYIIGSLGYHQDRKNTEITVFRLNTKTFEIEQVKTKGSPNCQINRHRAWLEDGSKIHIADGKKQTGLGKKEKFTPNADEYVLDLLTMSWAKQN